MAQFETSRWADAQFSQDYRDDAEIYLPYRNNFFMVAKSYFDFFLSHKKQPNVLDLGCGDGRFIQELLRSHTLEKLVLLDGSKQMLESAEKRLAGHVGLNFIEATFQELLSRDPLTGQRFDFIFSSLAIHHLTMNEKKNIYEYVYKHLSPDGHFLNYDVVIAPSTDLEKWYMSLWRLWIEDHPEKDDAAKLLDTPEKYKTNIDNIPDSLNDQLQALRFVGFEGVDCFFKYGAFALFGGSRRGSKGSQTSKFQKDTQNMRGHRT
jgi:tRNA (cmo5U34)-methyltransferase